MKILIGIIPDYCFASLTSYLTFLLPRSSLTSAPRRKLHTPLVATREISPTARKGLTRSSFCHNHPVLSKSKCVSVTQSKARHVRQPSQPVGRGSVGASVGASGAPRQRGGRGFIFLRIAARRRKMGGRGAYERQPLRWG